MPSQVACGISAAIIPDPGCTLAPLLPADVRVPRVAGVAVAKDKRHAREVRRQMLHTLAYVTMQTDTAYVSIRHYASETETAYVSIRHYASASV